MKPLPTTEQGETLVEAAMSGDREAMAQFIALYGDRIRRRFRGKLFGRTRALFDSEDLLWHIAASMDRYIVAGRLKIEREEQLWALLFQIGERAVQRQSNLAGRLGAADVPPDGLAAAAEPAAAALQLPSDAGLGDADRELLMLWGRGHTLAAIARLQRPNPASVRKRWERLRRRLRVATRDSGPEEAKG